MFEPRESLWLPVIGAVIGSAVLFCALAMMDAFEGLHHATRGYEAIQLDELLLSLALSITIGACVWAVQITRRMRYWKAAYDRLARLHGGHPTEDAQSPGTRAMSAPQAASFSSSRSYPRSR
mgnify:CR=1 FL=1